LCRFRLLKSARKNWQTRRFCGIVAGERHRLQKHQSIMIPSPAERDELLKGFARALFRGDTDALYGVVTLTFSGASMTASW